MLELPFLPFYTSRNEIIAALLTLYKYIYLNYTSCVLLCMAVAQSAPARGPNFFAARKSWNPRNSF